MKNINIEKHIAYGVIGLVIGMVIASMVFYCHMGRGYRGGDRYEGKSSMMHKMKDGRMMKDMDMNTDMASMMHSMNSTLEGKTGTEFDKAFLSEMIVHHQGAVAMAEQVLATSKKPELIKLANDIISAQNKVKKNDARQGSCLV